MRVRARDLARTSHTINPMIALMMTKPTIAPAVELVVQLLATAVT